MKRKLLAFSYCLLVIALFSGCADTANNKPGPHAEGLTFIHINDTYRVGDVAGGAQGGLARVATIVREAKAQGRDVRILHAGDFLYPSLESGLVNGVQMIDAFNFLSALAPMYVVAGNHEFDPHTPDALANAIKLSKFDWLGDNYRLKTGQPEVDAALHSAFTFKAGQHTIGIFALTTDANDGGNDRDYGPINGDYVGAAQAAIEQLEGKGVDLIIGLTHLYIKNDLQVAALRAKHPKFVFIVGGHEHEPEFSKLTAKSAQIMKGASDAREIWRIDVSFDANDSPSINAKMIDMDESVATDPDYLVLQNKWQRRLLDRFPFLEARIGVAAAPLDGRETTIRNKESSWGDFIVDQMRGAFGEPAADLAFTNSGSLRLDDVISGDISFEDVARTFPFTSNLRYLTMTGAEFREVLESGYRGLGPSKGYFPQVSGFRVCVDRRLPDGHRIVSLQVPGAGGWHDIEDSHKYLVVAPDFLYGGGDGYTFPPDDKASRPGSELKYRVLDAIIRAQAAGKNVGAAVDPAHPRFDELKADQDRCFDGSPLPDVVK